MGDPELEAIRQRRMQEMMAQDDMVGHHNPEQQKAQEDAKREADERRQLMLSQILSVQARERCSDLLVNGKRGPKDDLRVKVHAEKTFCSATCVDEDDKLIVSGAEGATSAFHQEQSNNISSYYRGVKIQEKLHTVKRQTRQWAAWTRQEEENFFLALRQVGKNFEKITCRVQSKNRDQVRHYYYRLVRRINKLLAPGFCLDAKNSKDTIAAMLRWWSLLEKFSCSASKLHLKPRRLKIFREALELQLLKDRNRGRKKHLSQGANLPSVPLAMIFNRTSENGSCSVKLLQVDGHSSQKIRASKGVTLKRNTATNSDFASSQKSARQNRRAVSIGESAAYRRWEKAAIAGVSLVADAAEQLEHAHHDRTSNQKISSVACSGEKDANNAGDDECPVPYLMLRGTSSHWSRDTAMHSSAKLKLQLFPIDEVTRRALEKDAQNPHLELILSARKRISSVVEHLNRKWGKSTIASGELVLLPYIVQQDDIANSHRWTIKDTVASAADVYSTIGCPTIFRLRYGWFPLAGPGSGVQGLSMALQPEKHIQVVDIHQLYASNAIPIGKTTEADDSSPSNVCCTSTKLEPMNCRLTAESRVGLPNVSHQSLCSRCDKEDGDDKEVDPEMRNEAAFTPVEWPDSLMSVGDLLSEASKAANSSGTSLTSNVQQLQFSYDSFDAAIAAHIAGHYSTRSPTQQPLSSIWHAEETCDGFSTQLPSVAREEDSNPLTNIADGVERENTCTKSMDFRAYLKDLTVPDTLNEFSIEDLKCGSKSHGEMPSDGRMHDFPTESAKQMFSDPKDPSLTDSFWPDSLGPVVFEMPSSKYHSQDIIVEQCVTLGGLSHQVISSLDGF